MCGSAWMDLDGSVGVDDSVDVDGQPELERPSCYEYVAVAILYKGVKC